MTDGCCGRGSPQQYVCVHTFVLIFPYISFASRTTCSFIPHILSSGAFISERQESL